jgi:ankyrin repeat protein
LKADINDKDSFEITPFHYICRNPSADGFNLEILKYCSEVLKADINDKDSFGDTPFYYICARSRFIEFNMEILRYCCEVMKADINIKNNSIQGYTSFYYLCNLETKHNILKYLGKNNLLTNETIQNSELSTRNKLKYFTKRTLVNLDDPDYVMY